MRKKNVLVTILIILILLVTIVFVVASLQQQNKFASPEIPPLSQPEEMPYQENEEPTSLLEEVSEKTSPSLSGSVVEVIRGADASSDLWIKVLSQQQNGEDGEGIQKEYAFFLSAEATQGDKQIEGGESVTLFYQGELSETDYVFVGKIEKIQ
jgi:hypothetical protein